MTKAVYFMPAARQEVIEAQTWYEKQRIGLGAEFRADVDRHVVNLSTFPHHYPILLADVKRVRLDRFPYTIFFRELPEAFYVIACFHESRDPAIWRGRM